MAAWILLTAVAAVVLYLVQLNRLIRGVPEEIGRLKSRPWTPELVRETYARLEKEPFAATSMEGCRAQLPPRLERRYIVTGGCGLVGGYIVQQLLARGQAAESIRIVDFAAMHRRDMLDGAAAAVEVVQTDISRADAVEAAFARPWPAAVAALPLTVFHTAAVIVPSARSPLEYRGSVLERVNVDGTRNLLAAARQAGADVFVLTSSASEALRPVGYWWRWPWEWPRQFVQRLDETDFFDAPRTHTERYCNYAVAKAAAERLVCDANGPAMRTGAVRPANGVYGHPTDNTVGTPLRIGALPSWSYNIVNCFVHGANCALAQLLFEAVLAPPDTDTAPQAGRPFTVTDPNAPIQFADLWNMLEWLSVTPFRTVPLPPVVMLLVAHVVEWYTLLPLHLPFLSAVLPPLMGDIRHLRPALFTIVSHVYATNQPASVAVRDGGLGYRGLVTTLEGMVQEVLEWNREHAGKEPEQWATYSSSMDMADVVEAAVGK